MPRDRRRAVDTTARLIAFVDALAAAAEAGLKEHDRWAAARAVLARKLAGRRATSRLPALIDYVMSSADRLGGDDCRRTPHHPARRAKSGGGLRAAGGDRAGALSRLGDHLRRCWEF